MAGGDEGSMGINTWVKASHDTNSPSRHINLGGKTTVTVRPGDRLEIQTPGGGGWGDMKKRKSKIVVDDATKKKGLRLFDSRGSVAERSATELAF